MKKKIKKKKKGKNKKKNKNKLVLLPVLAIIALLGLFSETMRTLPVGASSEKFIDISFEVPTLSNVQTEQKLIKNALLINERLDLQTLTNEIIDEEKKEFK